jgi:hypothetical protein
LEFNDMPAWEYRKIDLNDLPRGATDLDLLDKPFPRASTKIREASRIQFA